jgi:UPF0716 family protein affecting phage T7 exclusion
MVETPMNVAKWPLLALLALPFMELVVFIAVTESIGFLWALGLLLATSLAGVMALRHAGGNQIARVRVALGEGGFTALRADSAGTVAQLAGILLLIPGFITDIQGLLLLFARCGKPSAGCLDCDARPRPPIAWSILRLSSGTRYPTPDRRGNRGEP